MIEFRWQHRTEMISNADTEGIPTQVMCKRLQYRITGAALSMSPPTGWLDVPHVDEAGIPIPMHTVTG